MFGCVHIRAHCMSLAPKRGMRRRVVHKPVPQNLRLPRCCMLEVMSFCDWHEMCQLDRTFSGAHVMLQAAFKLQPDGLRMDKVAEMNNGRQWTRVPVRRHVLTLVHRIVAKHKRPLEWDARNPMQGLGTRRAVDALNVAPAGAALDAREEHFARGAALFKLLFSEIGRVTRPMDISERSMRRLGKCMHESQCAIVMDGGLFVVLKTLTGPCVEHQRGIAVGILRYFATQECTQC